MCPRAFGEDVTNTSSSVGNSAQTIQKHVRLDTAASSDPDLHNLLKSKPLVQENDSRVGKLLESIPDPKDKNVKLASIYNNVKPTILKFLHTLDNYKICIRSVTTIEEAKKILPEAHKVLEILVQARDLSEHGRIVPNSATGSQKSTATSSSMHSVKDQIHNITQGTSISLYPRSAVDAFIECEESSEQTSNLDFLDTRLQNSCEYLASECAKLVASIYPWVINRHKDNIIKILIITNRLIFASEKHADLINEIDDIADDISIEADTHQRRTSEFVVDQLLQDISNEFQEQRVEIIEEERRDRASLAVDFVFRNDELALRKTILADEENSRSRIYNQQQQDAMSVKIKTEQREQFEQHRRHILQTEEEMKRDDIINLESSKRDKYKDNYDNGLIRLVEEEIQRKHEREVIERARLQAAFEKLSGQEVVERNNLVANQDAEHEVVIDYGLRSSIRAADLARERIQRERAVWEDGRTQARQELQRQEESVRNHLGLDEGAEYAHVVWEDAKARARQELQAREENIRNNLVANQDAEREVVRDYSLRSSAMAEDLARQRIQHQRAAWENTRERARQELQRQEEDAHTALLIDEGLGFNRITTEGLTSFRLSSDRANQRIQQQQQREREREAREAMERAREAERLRREQADREAEAARQAAVAHPRCCCD